MKIALLGYGTIGKSFLRYIEGDDRDIQVSYVLVRPGKAREPYMCDDIDTILSDPEVETVVDALSGTEASYNYMLMAMRAGKNVVSCNKAAIAYDMESLVRTAEEHHVGFRYEASSGGTIPIINEIIAATDTNYISSVYGILNGTTNFIMDKMLSTGADFEETLKKAQDLGYAETDPTADISGYDAKNKIIILSNTAYHGFVVKDFPVTGIEKITGGILSEFKSHGKALKLLGISVRDGNDYALGVAPCVIDLGSQEAHVPLNYNLVTLIGDMCGDVKFYGQGAGGYPTADALLRDIYSIGSLDKGAARERFFNELHYRPELLKGIGHIGGKKVEGTLSELTEMARREDQFMAFEWPHLLMNFKPVIPPYMRTVKD